MTGFSLCGFQLLGFSLCCYYGCRHIV
uniref:Uncharacterized protein n=1 Tax=Anguilla anguilla TaxID=7936 RepID=A0A0E9P561_ANGAN